MTNQSDALALITDVIKSQDDNNADLIPALQQIMDAAQTKMSTIAINTETEVTALYGVDVNDYGGGWDESSGDFADHWSSSSYGCW